MQAVAAESGYAGAALLGQFATSYTQDHIPTVPPRGLSPAYSDRVAERVPTPAPTSQ